ncbi:MAG: to ATP-dependent protease La [Verrucomicrobiota bacterium]
MSAPDTELINILNAGAGGDTAFLRAGAKPMPDVLPILGLSDIVIFPGMVAPLLVESAQSTKLVDDVVAGDRFVGLVLQTKPEVQEPKPDELWSHGCAARVLKMLKFPDNTVRVLVEGLRRFQLKEFVAQEPYLRARVELLTDLAEDSVEITALTRSAHEQFQQIVSLSPALSDQVKINSLAQESPSRLADLIAQNLNLDLQERQRLLEITSVKERLGRLLPLMHRELEVLTLGTKIQKEVTTAMSKSQRDFFLREQIRAIQRELGETDTATADANNLREALDKAGLPPEVRKVADKELERLQQTPPAVAEYSITRNYLDWLATLPWSKSTEDKLDLDEAARLLDQQHFGLKKVKDRLIEFLAVIKLRQQLKGPILCLVGPPGVGKTSLGKSVADALGRKFARISLGGMRDEAEIRGHRRTYVGAMPGRIIQTMRRVESHNPVILLDEIDKVGADFRGDPSAALLEVLDPEQNSTFMDHYLDVPFDLSRVLFFTTANWLDPILPALRDRLEVIELPSYTLEEKVHIARRHLLPRQLAEHGVKAKQVKIPDSTLRKLAHDYTREAGCRQLDRELAAVVRKAARKIASVRGKARPVNITPQSLEEFLGQPKFIFESAENIAECGIAVGLAWTPVGGDILFIEATRMTGTGKLILTGSLGDVMKESVQAAQSYLRAQADSLGISDKDFDKHDIHVHVPAGATPKDGPSAGVTMIVALASLLTHRRVRSGLAMTGEISLRGRVLPVGGIKEKVLAAARAGIKQILLPEHNRKDWAEVPPEVRAKITVHFVRRISELLPLALVEAKVPKPRKGGAK